MCYPLYACVLQANSWFACYIIAAMLSGGSRGVGWVASHPPLWGHLSLKIFKNEQNYHRGHFLSGQPPPVQNPGSTTDAGGQTK